jgi:CRISPR/Cas system-associated exonuclease Cas4 (RecB family)
MINSDLTKPTPGQIFIPGATTVESPDHPTVARVHALPLENIGADRKKLTFEYLSGSQVSTYRRCQASYLFKYFYELREPDNTAMLFGSALHAAAEAYLRTKMEVEKTGPAPAHESLVNLAIEHAHAYIQRKYTLSMVHKTQWKRGPEDDLDSLLAGAAVAARRLADDVWAAMEPLEVERGFVIEWRDPTTLPFLGYADVILKTDRGQAVRDLKTGAEKSPIDAQLDIALSAYAQAYEIYSGQPTRLVGYDSYVRNKEPKLVSIEGSRSDGDLHRLYTVSKAITRSLAAGIYIPVDDSMKCGTCAFFERCRTEYA